ncbi:N-acetyl-gamma-glutamyl-phosphate reductase [Saccharophagus degradans]|uniref:N-acetyl-gamma-glutamyl-phosphate reductase n=1 Tax=Saccharophagus degradans (strain 2-40 / ATCC 43961 / DSM 17024) TaxID=203122 RepID=ARGC_SACD2|nr:N-acetyl-gamma-glutamyl-phosphate reductase [Saccharophagus degradans]Q21MI4.1 RecName: Full=N-acetyl-gamma-glutamyl-phosphate reductase; Short=AGPR; AltName: Full=N-acetyl-glutamate semialdehyde dehydrogenase; Short=NAGSA dehydrogenase [Saccharophagus degradans 2-40]ABD80095.1 N-acetyl-gamma-glutamyl-phosphate reductase [Saccharophagus degradans 2-40]
MIKVGIVGGTGYTGVELLRILASHPQAEVTVITSRAEAGRQVSELFPNLRGHYDLAFSEPSKEVLLECDVIFFATPHGVAQAMMAELIEGGARVIDLSADFRIRDIATWEKWYGQKHGCPDLVASAVYGLPEVNREKIKSAQLIACPGCYPTSIQLGFLPLLEKGLIDVSSLIANSASGTTGAGKQASVPNLFSEASDSFKAYGAAGHRHLPEIEQGLVDIGGEHANGLSLTFVPHLLPTIRGIHSTLYAKLKGDAGDLQALYEQRYANEPFVDVLPKGDFPQTRTVKSTNMCRISVIEPQERGTVVIMSVIDNLTKGASGQGVQNMNIMFGLDENMGMSSPAILP